MLKAAEPHQLPLGTMTAKDGPQDRYDQSPRREAGCERAQKQHLLLEGLPLSYSFHQSCSMGARLEMTPSLHPGMILAILGAGTAGASTVPKPGNPAALHCRSRPLVARG